MRFEICRMRDLTTAEKMVLGRIASFDEYYEAVDVCAELLGYTVGTVRKAKQKLERLGYITAIANTGRGKRYVAREDFRISPRKKRSAKPSEESSAMAVQPVVSPLRPSTSSQKPRKNWDKWKEKNKPLLPALDACENYLLRHEIPLVDPRAFRRQLTQTANMFKKTDDPDYANRVIVKYIEYLESPEYLYQMEHTKFCPVITTQFDLFAKFGAVREFKWNTARHYDPRKVLTRD